MKTLYIDCNNGISGDMLRQALENLADKNETDDCLEEQLASGSRHRYESEGKHHFHRSYMDVKEIINDAKDFSQYAKQVARDIYRVIAKAEASVHGESLDTIHFHEVGRDMAIINALRTGTALERLIALEDGDKTAEAKDMRILVSSVNDGKGFVDCAHGRIPVPVPAVSAMMDECGKIYPDYDFGVCDDVETEMVTPSGLAALIGIGAIPAKTAQSNESGMAFMEGKIVKKAEVSGTRYTGRGGLTIYLIES